MGEMALVFLLLLTPRALSAIRKGLEEREGNHLLAQAQEVLLAHTLLDGQRRLLNVARGALERSMVVIASILRVSHSASRHRLTSAELLTTTLILSLIYPLSLSLIQWSSAGGSVKFGEFRIFSNSTEVEGGVDPWRAVLLLCALGPPVVTLLLKRVLSIEISLTRLVVVTLVVGFPSLYLIGFQSHTVRISILMIATLLIALAYSQRSAIFLAVAVVICSFPISHYLMSDPLGKFFYELLYPGIVPPSFCKANIEGYLLLSPPPDGGYTPEILEAAQRCDQLWKYRMNVYYFGKALTLLSAYLVCAFLVWLFCVPRFGERKMLLAISIFAAFYFFLINAVEYLQVGTASWLFAPMFFFISFPISNGLLDYVSLRFTLYAFSRARSSDGPLGFLGWMAMDASFIFLCIVGHSSFLLLFSSISAAIFPSLVEDPVGTIVTLWSSALSSNAWMLLSKLTVALPSLFFWIGVIYLTFFRLIVPRNLYQSVDEAVSEPENDAKKMLALWVQSLMLMAPIAGTIIVCWMLLS